MLNNDTKTMGNMGFKVLKVSEAMQNPDLPRFSVDALVECIMDSEHSLERAYSLIHGEELALFERYIIRNYRPEMKWRDDFNGVKGFLRGILGELLGLSIVYDCLPLDAAIVGSYPKGKEKIGDVELRYGYYGKNIFFLYKEDGFLTRYAEMDCMTVSGRTPVVFEFKTGRYKSWQARHILSIAQDFFGGSPVMVQIGFHCAEGKRVSRRNQVYSVMLPLLPEIHELLDEYHADPHAKKVTPFLI